VNDVIMHRMATNHQVSYQLSIDWNFHAKCIFNCSN